LSPGVEPTAAERQLVADQLKAAVGAGALTLEEFEARLDAAYRTESREELYSLAVGIPSPTTTPLQLPRASTGKTRKMVLGAISVAVVAVGTVLFFGSMSHPSPKKAAFIPKPKHLAIGVVPAGAFSAYDPANTCGSFGAIIPGGGDNCYLVVQFTNTGASPVSFVPADLRMVDLRGNKYFIGPVWPQCYDSVGVNSQETLKPRQAITVQLCYAVITGAIPQRLEGTFSLGGLVFTVPPDFVKDAWGGA